MEIKNPLLAVKNMEKGKSFYRRVLGLHVIADQGLSIEEVAGRMDVPVKMVKKYLR